MRLYLFITFLFNFSSVYAQFDFNWGGGCFLNCGKNTKQRDGSIYLPAISAVLNIGISRDLNNKYVFESTGQIYWVRLNRIRYYEDLKTEFEKYSFQGLAVTNSLILRKRIYLKGANSIQLGIGYRFVLFQQGIKYYDDWKYQVKRIDYDLNEIKYYNDKYAIQSKAFLFNFKYLKQKSRYGTFLSFTGMYKFPTRNDFKWNSPKGVTYTRGLSPYVVKEDNFFQFELTGGISLPLKVK